MSGFSHAAAAPGPAATLMSIGEVLTHLRPEFSDVTISKLRFLEAEGLVEPQRNKAGYRKYGWADVARLRFILAAQRENYLPLRVIRDQLDALDRGEADPALQQAARHAGLLITPVAGSGTRRAGHAALIPVEDPRPRPIAATSTALTRQELLTQVPLAEAVLVDLEHYGFIRGHAGRYDPDEVVVAMVAAQLLDYGLTPRHLRSLRTAVDREVALFAQLVAPLVRKSVPGAKDRAAEVMRELAALSHQLHAALVRIGLREQ